MSEIPFTSADAVTLARLALLSSIMAALEAHISGKPSSGDIEKYKRYRLAAEQVREATQKALDDLAAASATSRIEVANADFQEFFKMALNDRQVPSLQIALLDINAIDPFDIDIPSSVTSSARRQLGKSMGWHDGWDKEAANSLKKARECFAKSNPWLMPALVVGGALAIVITGGLAAPAVVGAGAAGLAGAAAVTSGLAALGAAVGMGGLAGGIAVLAGGGVAVGVGVGTLGAAIARQSHRDVEASLVIALAIALQEKYLGVDDAGRAARSIFDSVSQNIAEQQLMHRGVSDPNCDLLKDLKKREDAVRKARTWLDKHHGYASN